MLKKCLPLVLLFLAIARLAAQDAPGLRNVVGGQFHFHFAKGANYYYGIAEPSNDSELRSRGFSFNPYSAWKISRRSLFGLRLGIGRESTIDPSDNGDYKTISNAYSMAVFTRHYLKPEAKFGLFIEPYTAFSRTTTKRKLDNNPYYYKQNHTEFVALVGPGVAYHLSERISLLLRLGQVGYAFNKYENDDDDNEYKFSDFRFDFSMTSLNWGLEYRWAGK